MSLNESCLRLGTKLKGFKRERSAITFSASVAEDLWLCEEGWTSLFN